MPSQPKPGFFPSAKEVFMERAKSIISSRRFPSKLAAGVTRSDHSAYFLGIPRGPPSSHHNAATGFIITYHERLAAPLSRCIAWQTLKTTFCWRSAILLPCRARDRRDNDISELLVIVWWSHHRHWNANISFLHRPPCYVCPAVISRLMLAEDIYQALYLFACRVM